MNATTKKKPIPAPLQGSVKGQAIIDAAVDAFLTDGYHCTSMDRIAASAGVSKRTIYNRYQSKDELFGEVVKCTCEQLLPLDIPDEALNEPPEVFLEQLGITLLNVTLSSDVLALHRLLSFEVNREPELGRIFLEHGPMRLIKLLMRYFERQNKLGTLKIDYPEDAAWRLTAMMKEPLHLKCLFGAAPKDLDAQIKRSVSIAIKEFLKLYGVQ